MASIALRLAFCTAVLGALAAQKPAPDKPAEVKSEIARLVRDVDAILEQVRATKKNVNAAVERAERTKGQATEVELDRDAKVLADLQVELATLAAALEANLIKIVPLRDLAAARAPVAAEDPLGQFRIRIANAPKLPTLQDAEEALKGVENELQSDKWKKAPGADQLLGCTRFQLAEILWQQADLEISAKHNGRNAEKLYLRACGKFNDVVNLGPDMSNSGEGTSLHAAALLNVVKLEVWLHGYYKQVLDKAPDNPACIEVVKKHRAILAKTVDSLGRRFADATLPDGSNIAEAARREAGR